MSTDGKKIGSKFVAVEAGGEWLKIAMLEGAGSAPSISKLVLAEVEDGVDGLGHVFPGAWKKFKAGKEPVVVCLPRQLVTVRMIELPSVDPAEIDDMVDLQVGKQTPYSKDEIVYDYKLVAAGREGYTTVMLAIAQRSAVRQVYYAFEAAGIEVEKVTVSTEAVAGWIGKGKSNSVRAVLEVDSFYSDFMVIQGDAIVFSRSILVGADSLSHEASVGKLVKEVQSSLEVYRSEHAGGAIGNVTVSGVTGSVPGLVAALKESGLKCGVQDAAKALKRPPKGDAGMLQKMKNVSMSSIVGMGCSPESLEFNLVPDSISVRRNLMEKATSLTALASLVMTLLISGSLYASIVGFSEWDKLRSIEAELAKQQPVSQEVKGMVKIVRQIRARKEPGCSALALLNEIRNAQLATEEKTKMTNIDLDVAGGVFRVEGVAESTRDIRAVVKVLEKGRYFEDVRESASPDGKIKKLRYQITGELEAAK